jgi:hypothetical protein
MRFDSSLLRLADRQPAVGDTLPPLWGEKGGRATSTPLVFRNSCIL